jgi:hypothetical protein
MGLGQVELVDRDGAPVGVERRRFVPVARTPVTTQGEWAARLCPYGAGAQYAAWVWGFGAGWRGAAGENNPLTVPALREAWESGRVMGKAQEAAGG